MVGIYGLDISDGINFETDTIPFEDNFSLSSLCMLLDMYQILICTDRNLSVIKWRSVLIINIINNDPDHKKPYTPRGLSWLMQMYGFFKIGLWTVRKPSFLWGLTRGFMIGKNPLYGRNIS